MLYPAAACFITNNVLLLLDERFTCATVQPYIKSKETSFSMEREQEVESLILPLHDYLYKAYEESC